MLPRKQVLQILGIGGSTFDKWVRMGIITPTIQNHGRGTCAYYDDVAVLRIALARDLRNRGHSFAAVNSLLDVLENYTNEELQAAWDMGRVYVLMVGEMCMPRLMSRDEVEGNPEIDLLAAKMLGVPSCLIDVQKAYGILRARIDELEAAKA